MFGGSSAGTGPGTVVPRRPTSGGPAEATGMVNTGGEEHDPAATAPKDLTGEPPQLCNDPSAGSPTETLLRLLLPLNDQV